ncbi:FAD-binding domain-containing protein [Actinomadura rubrisoli]|uniref:FAD-binding domain-containing protein n=1 Tax=Actinomadura rubrisoli TaxID=2530368 RepID=UPI001FB7278E|nr:FAD-binding domain-containing protein [Actinomadura rubrisoli]
MDALAAWRDGMTGVPIVDARPVHRPWTLPADRRQALGYPPPIVEPSARSHM